MTAGVIGFCVNCRTDIGPMVFPHYCSYCLGVLKRTGQLPGGACVQESLDMDSFDEGETFIKE